MYKTITLFEYETKKFQWNERHVETLTRLRQKNKVDVLRTAVSGSEHQLKAYQYVGIVRLGECTIEILPKIYQSSEQVDEAIRAKEATRNLLYLLSYSYEVSIREHDIAALTEHTSDWFEILTHLFSSHLLDEMQRGAYRNYQTVEDELPVLKGKWRIADQLRHPERKHIFSVAYDEFTTDNPLNQVFRCVVERLLRLTRDTNNYMRLIELRSLLEDVTLRQNITAAESASSRLLNRLNEHYTPILNLARLFLEGGALQLIHGDLSTFAFTFDMNKVFEAFVVNFIRRHRDEILEGSLRHCKLIPQTRGETCHLAKSNGKDVFRLKPDLAFKWGDKAFPLLIDTKYKKLEPKTDEYDISPSDFYQMYAYAHRYKCPRVLMIYPQLAGMTKLCRSFTLEDGAGEIDVATLDLTKDLRDNIGKAGLMDRLRNLLNGATKQ